MKTPAAAKSDPIRIGVLSQMSGCSVPTIRYYEEVGLIPAASRRSSGHRVYDVGAVHLLAFIRRCRDFGFSIDQTRALVSLSHGKDRDCVEARDLAQRGLARFVESCNATCLGGSAPKCTILKDLGRSAKTAGRGGCCG